MEINPSALWAPRYFGKSLPHLAIAMTSWVTDSLSFDIKKLWRGFWKRWNQLYVEVSVRQCYAGAIRSHLLSSDRSFKVLLLMENVLHSWSYKSPDPVR